MQRRILILLGLVGVLGLALLARSLSTGGTEARPLEGTARVVSSAPSTADLAGEPDPTPPTDSTPARQTAQTPLAQPWPKSWTESEAIWLRGQVRLPAGTPRDERVAVLALDAPVAPGVLGEPFELDPTTGFPPGALSLAEVDGSGSFAIDLPPGSREAHLVVAGRYLYSHGSRTVRLDQVGEVELVPRLGAWLQVDLRRGEDPEVRAQWPRERVTLTVVSESSLDQFDGSVLAQRHSFFDDEGGFSFRGVTCERAVKLLAAPDGWAAARSEELRLRPGERRQVRLLLASGGTVRGRVVGGEGGPIAGVRVFVVQGANFLAAQIGEEVRQGVSAEDGSFELDAVVPGVSSLRAELEGFLQCSRSIELGPGDLLEDQELVLTRGGVIHGRVRWPDGEPAVDLSVHATFDLANIGGIGGLNAIRGVEAFGRTNELGEFEVSGLGRGPFVLEAEAMPPGTEPAVELDPESSWRARVEGVAPGSTVDLEMEPPERLVGTVRDLGGEPIERFRVTAMGEKRGLIRGFGSEVRQRTFESPEGRFEFGGLRIGTWDLTFEAEGFARRDLPGVSVPRPEGADGLQVELPRALAVEGRVLLPDGQPAVGASVELQLQAMQRMADAFHSLELPEAKSSEQGAFRLDGLSPGDLTLVATLEGFAESEPRSFELSEGVEPVPVELVLRRGATVTGQVYGDDGQPDVGAPVLFQVTGTVDIRQAGTDAEGKFRLDGLKPGTWQATAMPDEDTMASLLTDDAAGLGGLVAGMRMQVLDVREGESYHLVFGEPPPDPVTVTGQVTLDGKPQRDLVISFFKQELAASGAMQFERTNAEGRYEMVLAGGGEYVMLVQRMGQIAAENSLEFRQEIPVGLDAHEIDVELPLGKISGQVSGPDGEGVSGARITLESRGEVAPGLFWGGHYAELEAGEGGEYVVDWLEPGDYRITAGGDAFGSVYGKSSSLGRSPGREVSLAEGEHVEDVDFRLERAGTITGVVRDPGGRPVEKAALFVRDAQGRVADRVTWIESDGSGRYECPSLRPGSYTVQARLGLATSAKSEPIRVEAGRESEQDLVLDPGTLLFVKTTDAEGQPLAATLRVTDGDGHEVQGMFSLTEIMQALQGGGMGSIVQQVGPLLPGRYRVEASVPDGRSASKSVQVRGQAEQRVTLRLKP